MRAVLQVTHVVCPVDSNRMVKRTLKYAAASLSGKWVVDTAWVSKSVGARRLLPEVWVDFILYIAIAVASSAFVPSLAVLFFSFPSRKFIAGVV